MIIEQLVDTGCVRYRVSCIKNFGKPSFEQCSTRKPTSRLLSTKTQLNFNSFGYCDKNKMLLTSVIHPQSCLNYVKRLISSQSSEILYEKTKGKVVLTLNRPNQMNAMNATFQRQLLAAYKNIHSDPNVNLVIVKANGKVFCAGGDVKG